MGKILVNGHAEKEIAADRCAITLSVETEGMTAAKASVSAADEFEKLLRRLSELGIPTDCMVITHDGSSKPYRRDEEQYTSTRSVRIDIPVNTALVNRIHDIIGSGFENTTIGVKYEISSKAEILRSLTSQAVQESRKTADLIAETSGTKVVGIKAANLSGTDLDMDIADLDLPLADKPAPMNTLRMIGDYRDSTTPFSDQLKPEKIKLNVDVSVVWAVE